jgi:hypothetical protein
LTASFTAITTRHRGVSQQSSGATQHNQRASSQPVALFTWAIKHGLCDHNLMALIEPNHDGIRLPRPIRDDER